MIALSPKKRFQENEDAVRAFRAIVDSDHFQLALTYATAQYFQSNPTTDEVIGANSFLKVLMAMAETEQLIPIMPIKRLEIISDTRGLKKKTKEQPPTPATPPSQ